MSRLLLIFIMLVSLPCVARKKDKATRAPLRRMEVSVADQRRLSYYFLEGAKQKRAGNYTAAHDLFQHCLDIDPTSPEALYEMAYMKFYLHRDEEGMEMFRAASELDPQNPWYMETLAAAYLNEDDYAAAIPVLERLSKIQTKRTDVLFQLAELYKAEGETEKCISALDRIEVLEGRSIPTSMQKYALYQSEERQDEAFAELISLAEELPYDPRIPILLGREYLAYGEEEKALECYDCVARTDPGNDALQMAMIDYLKHKGEDSLRTALRDSLVNASSTSADLRLSLLSSMVDELRSAADGKERTLQLLDTMTARFPSAEIYTLRAAYFLSAKVSSDSLAMSLRDILTVDPSNQLALNRLLPYYVEKEDMENAVEICRMGINSYPDELAYHYFLGAALYRLNQLDDAIEAFNNGICQVDGDSSPTIVSDLYYVLGDCYHERGDKEASYEAYDKSLLCNEDNASCLNNYGYYLCLEGEQLDKAEQMSYRAIKLEPLNRTFLDTYAWVLFRKGNMAMAKFYIDRVIPPSADDETILSDEELHPEVIEHAADIYAANGLPEEAERYRRLAKDKEE